MSTNLFSFYNKGSYFKMDLNQNYLTQLHQKLDTNIENLRPYAEDNQVPIVDKLTLDMIKQLIRMNHTKTF